MRQGMEIHTMPRIRVAFGVVVAVTLCIGFNIAQYPVVWQMVAVGPNARLASEPARAAADTQMDAAPTTPTPRTASPAKPAATVTVVALANTPPPKPAAEAKPAAKKDSTAGKTARTAEKPTAADSHKKKAGRSNDAAKPKSPTDDLAAARKNDKHVTNEIRPPLVPIAQAPAEEGTRKISADAVFASVTTAKGIAGENRPATNQSRFERLPPLSLAEPTNLRGPQPSLAGNAIPFYPTTGR